MKTLLESLLDDEDILMNNSDNAAENILIHNFLKDNYKTDEDGKLPHEQIDIKNKIINCVFLADDWISRFSITVKNKKIKQLLPTGWKFGRVDGGFDCSYCENLKNLNQAPERIKNNLNLSYCTGLTSFKGNIKDVTENINCTGCINLKSWANAPKVRTGHFVIRNSGLSFEKIEAKTKQEAKTLYDCFENSIERYVLRRCLGPTRFKDVVDFCRFIHKKFKTAEIKDKYGRKSTQQLLSTVLCDLASQVEVNYNLQFQQRILDLQSKLNELILQYSKELKQNVVPIRIDIRLKNRNQIEFQVIYKDGELAVVMINDLNNSNPIFV